MVKRRGPVWIAIALLTIVGFAPSVGAQGFDEFSPPTPEPTIRITEIEVVDGTVTLEVEVPPAIAGSRLEPSAVSVIVDGDYRLAEVVRPPADDLVVILAVDVSGSTADGPLESATSAAAVFLDRLPEGSLVGLVSFGPEAILISSPTGDFDLIREGLESLASDGATALFDAVSLSAQIISESRATTRVIVVFSDGGDTNSTVELQTARDLVAAADARVDVVSLETEGSDPAALAALAGPDGTVISVDDERTLEAAFAELGDGLGNQFTVTIPDVGDAQLTIVVRGDDGVARGHITIDTGSGETTVAIPGRSISPAFTPTQTVTAVVPTVASPSISVEPGAVFGSRTFGYAVAAVLGGLLLGGIVVGWPVSEAKQMQKQKTRQPILRKKRTPLNAAKRLTAIADAGLAKADRRSKTAQRLEQAGLALRPGEFVVIIAALVLATLTLGTVVLGAKMGLFLAVVAVVGSRVWLVRRVNATRGAFADQLGATLQLLASNLRVGHGLLQGIDAIAGESEQPTAREFQRVVGEVRLGRDVGEALRAMADRLDNEDFRWVVQAVEIHREVGGDLAEVLDNVGITIRDRTRLKGQIHSLSADGRISAAVMMALPFCVAGLTYLTTPDYLDELTGRTGGQILLGIGALLMVIGGAWLKSIIRLQF